MPKRKITKREIAEMIVKTQQPKLPLKEPPKEKLRLNITLLKNLLKWGKKEAARNPVQAKAETVSTPMVTAFGALAKVVLGYGIVGSFLLSLLAIVLSLPLGITVVAQENLIVEIIILVLGTGSFFYLFFDIVSFLRDSKER